MKSNKQQVTFMITYKLDPSMSKAALIRKLKQQLWTEFAWFHEGVAEPKKVVEIKSY